MATKTFLELTNDVILESGADHAMFTGSGDFASPTDLMKQRFKRWTANAWRDIQQENPDWEFMMNEGVYVICPRINFFNGFASGMAPSFAAATFGLMSYDGTTTGPVGAEDFVSTDPIPCLAGLVREGLLSNGTARGWVDLESTPSDVIQFQLHLGSEALYHPLPGVASSFVYKLPVESWGSYDFAETPSRYSLKEDASDLGINDIKQINQQSFKIVNYASSVAQGAGTPNERELKFVPWESFLRDQFDFGMMVPSVPRFITEDYEGRYRFWPPPDRDYTVIFKYERIPQLMTEYDDVPNISEEFQDVIVWRAMQYYGRYDADPSIANPTGSGYADQNYKRLLGQLEYHYREKFHFKPHRMWTP